MSVEHLEQLKPVLQKALETMERQSKNVSLPASVRKQSARQLERYQAIIRKYPVLMQEMQEEEGDGTKKSG